MYGGSGSGKVARVCGGLGGEGVRAPSLGGLLGSQGENQ